VGAGVDDAGARVVVGQVGVVGAAGEGELQDLHAGQPEGVAQRLDVGGDHAQVLGHDGQPAQLAAQHLEQPAAGALDPAAPHGRRLVGGDLPVGGEAAEVVDTHDVDLRQRAPQPRDPPRVAARLVHVPAVERVAPALAGGREVVWRHAGDHRRAAVVVEVEQLRVRPDVGG